jgi:single-stranded-DNA-specific exonuclease
MDPAEGLSQAASNAAAELGSCIASGKQIRLISHNDVDGLSAGTLLFLALRDHGADIHLTFTSHVYREELPELVSSGPDVLVFCDMGSDLVPDLRRGKIPFLVLDHHATDQRDEALVNPEALGMDGTREVSGAGVAYLVAKALDPGNAGLAPIAICGAFGDMQSLVGENERIAADAESRGLAKRRKEIRLIGRVDRPVEYSLAYSTLPFLKGLSGNPMAANTFLKETGIDVGPKETIAGLDDEMERQLISGLVEYMVQQDASTFEAERIFGLTFRLPKMPVPTMDDLVDYVEACGALGNYSTAFSLLSGDGSAREDSERSRLAYKERIFEGVGLFEDAVHLDNIDYLVMEGWSKFSGKLAAIYANAGFSGNRRPIFTINVEDDWAKVSARVNPQLVERGLDLGAALSAVAPRFGGNGGGHDVAAGAKFPRAQMEGLLRELDREVGSQLAGEEEE